MSFYEFFKGFFGNFGNENWHNSQGMEDDYSNKFRNPVWEIGDEDPDDEDFRHGPSASFHVFTNPLEIHRYFEQQFSEIIRNFHSFPGSFENGPDMFVGGFDNRPALPAPRNENEGSNQNLRDLYLKPDFESPGNNPDHFVDSDLDGKIDPKAIGEILTKEPGTVFESDFQPRKPNTFLGKSVISRTTRRPDGTIEMHKTVKDSLGNEETTITRRKGDQTYSVTITKDANGEEKRTENFINIDEDKIAAFNDTRIQEKPMLPFQQPSEDVKLPVGATSDLSYWLNKFFK